MRVRIRRFGERQGTQRTLALEPLLAVRAGNDSALWQDPGGFTAFAPSEVPLSGEVGLPGSFLEHPAPGTSTVRPFPAHTCDLTGTMASADPCRLSPASQPGLPSTYQRLGNRSPQIRALAVPASLPDLPLCLLMAWTSWLVAHSSRLTASYRVRVPQVAVLPPASFRPRLAATPLPLATVGAINPREGLPPSKSAPMLGVQPYVGGPRAAHVLLCRPPLEAR